MNIFRIIVLSSLFGLSILSCDAPRINPLDPENPDSKLGVIDGYVITEAIPRIGIPGAKVSWRNQNIILETDANGYFNIENIPLLNGWLYYEKLGYSKDSVLVYWNNQKIIHFENQLVLNSSPILQNLSIYSSVENRYPDVQRYWLYIKAQISDAENDLDSVKVICGALNFSKQLTFNIQTRYWELPVPYFYGTNKSSSSIDDAIGKNFDIIVKDRYNRIFNIGSPTIKRIIKQEILFESPANAAIVGSKPVLRWKRFLPGFNFKYMIQIYSDEIEPRLNWEKSNVLKDDIEIIPDLNLTPGNYYWVIWCVDDFQNRSRSKPATFSVR